MDNKENIIKDLLGKSTVKRRKTAIKLREINYKKLFNAQLINAYRLEYDSKNWLTKIEIIKALSFNECYDAIDLLKKTVFDKDLIFDLVQKESALSLVRLCRNDEHDVKCLIKIIENCNYSSKEGALEALGYDKMIPSSHEQNKIISVCHDFGQNRPKGYTDPRYGLAAACAGWKSEKVIGFLEDCIQSKDTPLIYVAQNSIKGKYVKLR